ncbi:hypothetical protein ATE92_1058 [Ulvibacter sp. MAR_2010_11]|uniref:hypothetical protein n=1 Tax=Ulvibacter sp. MAR_2010_11 TaxID=1250229 RepID=UPI000C2C2AAF|nr:hypothetical protein [Ulvibacter sp. MAR_2010_11]PKA82917.1 hypothetical protein ATE92_1058 [Ulvibacter sp. MAR_2010_11]
MFRKAENYIRSNFSLLLIVLGAGSNFLLILFFKKYIPDGFNTFSLYLTYLGIVGSFGLIGFDQIFLRLSIITEDKILIGRDVYIFLLLSLFISPTGFSLYFSARYLDLYFLPLLISGISINGIIVAYNLFRLQKSFVISQLYKSGHKVVFFVFIVFFSFIYTKLEISDIINATTGILSLFGSFAVFYFLKKINTRRTRTPSLFNFFLSFSINLAVITSIGFGERILIANELGEDIFGKYFYYSTVFLFPLTLVQQYIGFKELIYFKERIDKRKIIQKLKRITLIGFLIILFIFMFVILDNGFLLEIDIESDIALIGLLSILGLVKIIYGLFSAILGAKGKFKDIYIINICSVALITILLFSLNYLHYSLNYIVSGLIIVFLFRTFFIYYRYAK